MEERVTGHGCKDKKKAGAIAYENNISAREDEDGGINGRTRTLSSHNRISRIIFHKKPIGESTSDTTTIESDVTTSTLSHDFFGAKNRIKSPLGNICVCSTIFFSIFIIFMILSIWGIGFTFLLSTINGIVKSEEISVRNSLVNLAENGFNQLTHLYQRAESHIRNVEFFGRNLADMNVTCAWAERVFLSEFRNKTYAAHSSGFIGFENDGRLCGLSEYDDYYEYYQTNFEEDIGKYVLHYRGYDKNEENSYTRNLTFMDVRLRGYYQNTVAFEDDQRIAFSAPFNTAGGFVGIPLSKKLLDKNGNLVGVYTMTFHLDFLSRELSKLGNSLFYLMNDGFLLAAANTNYNEPLLSDLNVTQHSNSVYKAAGLALWTLPDGGIASVQGEFHTVFKSEGLMYYLNGYRYTNPFGVSFLIVDISSVWERYKAVQLNVWISISIGVFIVILSLGVSSLFAFSISTPIATVSKRIKDVARMKKTSVGRGLLLKFFEKWHVSEVKDILSSVNDLEDAFKRFNRFMPSGPVCRYIMNRKVDINNHVWQVLCTIMFADIVENTKRIEMMLSVEIVELLSNFFQVSYDVITAFQGTVDKFVGDCAMALFNTPIPVQKHEEKAVLAALQLCEQISHFGYDVRIGINTGKCLAGFFGSKERLQYTVVGDGVNVASRLEQLGKEHQSRISISEAVHGVLDSKFECRYIAKLRLRGKSNETKVFEVLGESKSKSQAAELVDQ